jgi:hypothetical protein
MSSKSFKASRPGFVSLLERGQYGTEDGKKGRHSSPNEIKQLVNMWKLGDQAVHDMDSNILIIQAKVRTVVSTLASIDDEGYPIYTWAKEEERKKVSMVDALVEKYPWMAKFERSWAAEVFLSLHINRKNTQRRKRAKESAHITTRTDGMSAYSVYLL